MKNTEVWIINGIPGSGKSTTAKALAKHFQKAAYIEGDTLQDFIISGNVSPGQEPKDEESKQIHLNVKNQCLLAKSFSEAGFIPVIDYIVVNKNRVQEYKDQLEGFTIYLVTLNPGVEAALERDRNRPEKTVAHLWTHLHEEIKAGIADTGFWIDNSTLTVEETVQEILNNRDRSTIK